MLSARQVLSITQRHVRKRPMDFITMSLSLALGMLLLVLILAAVNGFLFRPLAVPQIEELVRIREVQQADNGDRSVFSVAPAAWQLWQQEELRSFVDIAVATGSSVTLGLSDAPEQREAALISANFLGVLGIQPSLGRGFAADADLGDGADQVLIGDVLWKDRFASDPNVIGRTLHIDGRAREIIGVMPAAMSHPYDAEVWLPIALGERLHTRVGNYLYGLGRLQPGVSPETAEQELSQLVARLEAEHADLVDAVAVELTPLRDELVGDLRPALMVLAAASVLAFLVALLNCTTLAGLRALRDRPTVAVRAALGARHSDVLADAFVRHLGTSLFAAALALIALGPLSGPLLGLAGSSSINEFDVSPRADWSTIGITVLVALVAAAVLTLVEAATMALAVANPTLLRETRMTHSRATGHWLRAVAIGQMVASIMVVTGALLVTENYLDQVHGDRGFIADDLWLVDVTLPASRFADTPARMRYVDQVIERLRATPGVVSAGAATVTPDEGGSWGAAYQLPGQEPPAIGYHLSNHRLVSAGYFNTLGIPVLRGQDFGDADFAPDARSVIVSEEFARRSWPDREALGQQIQRHRTDQVLTVIGVVGNVREAEQADDWDETATWYLPDSLGTGYDFNQMTFAVRLQGAAETNLPPALEAIRNVDRNLALVDIASMSGRLSATYSREVYTSRLFGAFAIVALLIAAIGAYALLAFMVAARRSEFGLRLALGESPGGLLRRLLGDALLVALAGIAIGLPLSWASGRILASQLDGLPQWSPAQAGIAVAACLVLQLAAIIGPSLRAMRVSPNVLLRAD